jgi:hypothetical protein
MKRVTRLTTWILLIGSSLLVVPGSPASATVIGIPGNAPTNLPAGPPNPNLPGYNLYPFMLDGFLPPSPNPLPDGLFAESPLQFNLAMLAGFGPSGKTDPIVAPQTFNFFIIGDFWSVQAQFEYKPKSSILSPSDVVTMTGDAVHRIAPHAGEFAPGPAVPFKVVLNAGSVVTLPPDLNVPGDALRKAIRDANLPAGARFGADFRSAIHDAGPDEDVIFAILAGQISSPNNPFVGNELEFWVGGVAGLHAPTPEPTTLLLWGTTAAGLGFIARRRRKARAQTTSPGI